jgi:hypothetical protein
MLRLGLLWNNNNCNPISECVGDIDIECNCAEFDGTDDWFWKT